MKRRPPNGFAKQVQYGRGRVPEEHGEQYAGTAGDTLSHLKRDNPELAQQVVNGEISAYAAARKMGWKRPRILLGNPDVVARKLIEHMDPFALLVIEDILAAHNTGEPVDAWWESK